MIDYDFLRKRFEEVDAESSYFSDNDELIIDARDSQVSDRELELLRGLTNITYANFANTSITNAGIMILRPNHRLGYLDLFNTSCTESCINDFGTYWCSLGAVGLGAIARFEALKGLASLPLLRTLEIETRVCSAEEFVELIRITGIDEVTWSKSDYEYDDFRATLTEQVLGTRRLRLKLDSASSMTYPL